MRHILTDSYIDILNFKSITSTLNFFKTHHCSNHFRRKKWLIKQQKLREKVFKEIMAKLTIEDILKASQHMSPTEKHAYFQDILRRANDLTDELRQQIIELMMKNAQNLDEAAQQSLLSDLMQNLVKDMSPEMAAKSLNFFISLELITL